VQDGGKGGFSLADEPLPRASEVRSIRGVETPGCLLRCLLTDEFRLIPTSYSVANFFHGRRKFRTVITVKVGWFAFVNDKLTVSS
jgi:hypothetical protein